MPLDTYFEYGLHMAPVPNLPHISHSKALALPWAMGIQKILRPEQRNWKKDLRGQASYNSLDI